MGEVELRGGTAEELAEPLAYLERFVERWRARDWDWVRTGYTEDAQVVPPANWMWTEPTRDADAAVSRWQDITDPVEDLDVEVLSLELVGRAAEATVLIFEFIWRGTAVTSGLPFEMQMIQVVRRRAERIDYQAHFYDLEEARIHARSLLSPE